MTTLAERLAPHLYGPLEHPVHGVIMSPLAGMNAMTMPPGMAEEMAKEAGLPEPNIALLLLECVLHLLETEGVELVDKAAMADLRAAAEHNEGKRNQVLIFTTPCGAEMRAMAKGFDTGRPSVPCALVVHDCKGR